ncbi:hypothetical protein XELAEV_18043953mg [Xenopus laevis]|uniref:Uncharacterized protein n=1 Tax=Xenopus laevis TaxID=8355 RepID=A0A974BY73_XENLA|nr:hypothetical protein XELAEV_18043953mg [Xenopus laevis]
MYRINTKNCSAHMIYIVENISKSIYCKGNVCISKVLSGINTKEGSGRYTSNHHGYSCCTEKHVDVFQNKVCPIFCD